MITIMTVQIEELKKRKADGEELDPDQEKKILRKDDVEVELERLSSFASSRGN